MDSIVKTSNLVIFKKISEAIFQTFIKQKFYEKNLNK